METIPPLDRAGLRKFGLTFGAIVAVLFGAVLPWLFGFGYRPWPWILAGVFVLWAAALPHSLAPFYRLWMKFGLVMNAVMSRLVLGAVFYLVVLPTGIIARLCGKDPMRRKLDEQTTSYRIISRPAPPDHMEKPF